MTQPPQPGPVPHDPYAQAQPGGQPPYGAAPGQYGAPQAQYGGGQPQYGAPGPYQQAPMGTVALTVQGSVMTSSMLTPSATINGHHVATRYGRQDIPVPAGPIHLEMSAQWMRTYGQAALDFTIAPGQTVPVFYAAPLHQFTTGSIGYEKQKRKGLGFVLGLSGVVVLMILLLAIIPALLSQ